MRRTTERTDITTEGSPGRATPRPGRIALLSCVLAVGIVSCCGASMEGVTTQEPDRQVETVDDAAARFDQAERDLHATLVTRQDKLREYPDETAPGGYQAQPGPPPPPAPGEVARADEESRRRQRCATACRALASMQRSADRLCTLAGETDARCENVRHRVRAARRLVRRLCPSCTA